MAKPRFATPLPTDLESWAPEIEAEAEAQGHPLMPWQSDGAAYVGARRPDGRPRFKTVIASVPRQSGKTVLSRGAIGARAKQAANLFLYGTAQTRQYAAKHVLSLGLSLGKQVKTLRGVGAESVTWPNGSVYAPLSPTEGGGHGDSMDFLLVDEGWALTTTLLGGVRPAMIARPQSQLLIISTMGTRDSTTWNGLVARGRESVDDPKSDVAYLEYSAPTDEAVFEDTCEDDSRIGTDDCVWGQWMPALGITVSHEDIRSAIEDMLADPAQGRSEVVRAFGNRTVTSLVTVFPSDWLADAWSVIEPPQKFVLAVDVHDGPTGAALAQGFETDDDRIGVRPVEWQYGSPRWLVGRVEQMLQARSVEAVAGDFGGPAKQVHADLIALCERYRVPLLDRQPGKFASDSMSFYDALRERQVAMQHTEQLEAAVNGAARKDLESGVWLIRRRGMRVDPTPLIASVIAYGVARELSLKPKVRVRFVS